MTPHDTEEREADAPSSPSHALLAQMIDQGFQFSDSARQTQINITLQLLRVNNRVLVIRGATGMGKTAFLANLAQRGPEELAIARAAARPDMTLEQLLAGLASSVGVPSESNPLDILRDISEQMVQPVLLIDDADQLTDEVLGELASLWQMGRSEGVPLRLVFASTGGLNVRLAKKIDPDWVHSINLHPLSEKQTVDYLTQRLDAAGLLSMDLVAPAEMRAIHERSGGVPAHIDHELRQLLNARTAGGQAPASPAKTGRSARRMTSFVVATVLLLTAALIGAVLYTERWQPSQQVPPAATPAAAPEAAVQPETPRKEQEPATNPPTGVAEETASAERPAQAPAETVGPVEPTLPEQAVTPELALRPEPEPQPEPQLEAQLQPELLSPPEALSQPELLSPPEALSQPEPLSQPEAQTQTQAGEQTAQVEQPTAPAPAAKPPTTATENDWLRARVPNRYTIQLIAARDGEGLREFIQTHGIDDRAALLGVERDGRIGYVVVYGDYSSWARANAALKSMPRALRGDGAWVRKFGDLQKLVRD